MPNFLTAIKTIVECYEVQLQETSFHANRMNAMGAALELFVKNAFSDAFGLQYEAQKKRYSEVFSYSGNQNNPPDMMLKDGDAIEVKKLERLTNAIALNSSYPKDKLSANSSMITDECRSCESWQEKDLIYAVGTVEEKVNLRHLWLIYGDCFVANSKIYDRIKQTISTGINSIEYVDFAVTTELGKVKKVDPLGVTDLRIRGMWSIQNPSKIFSDIHPIKQDNAFQLSCLVKNEKFLSFPESDQKAILFMQSDNFTISDVSIQNPNNPAQLMPAKLFYFRSVIL